MMNRRFFLGAGALAIAGGAWTRGATAAPFEAIERSLGGRVGVMVLDTGDGTRLSHRADERFALCSTFKWALAACVLAHADRGELALTDRLSYTAADLLDHAPVTRERLGEGSLPIGELCRAAVTVSDNTAANLLLGRVGGPGEFTAFVRRCGDDVTRLDRIEPDLNSNVPGDPRDTTTPHAMTELMRTLLLGEVLAAASRERLLQWLKDAKTGYDRLRAGLPGDWVVGDKTGSGANDAANDVAIAWPPGRPPVLVAAYLSESGNTREAQAAALRQVAATAAKLLR